LLVQDVLAHTFCSCCAVAQEARVVERKQKKARIAAATVAVAAREAGEHAATVHQLFASNFSQYFDCHSLAGLQTSWICNIYSVRAVAAALVAHTACTAAGGERLRQHQQQQQQQQQQKLPLGTKAAVAGALAVAVFTAARFTTCGSEIALVLLLLEVSSLACYCSYCCCYCCC
jgi:hypothetical protein